MPNQNQKLRIIIEAKDTASRVIGNVGGSLKRFATAGIAGTAALVGGIGLLGSKLVDLGSDAEEMQAKFDTVFGDGADYFVRQFDTMADGLNRNKYELREFGAALQDTFVPLGFARDEAGQMALQMTELTVDMASFNNAAEPDVLRDLQSALVGNHETVRKYGVILTEAVLKQELARMGMEDLEGAALEQAKVQARMNLILAGTTDAQGDAARTADSWANQMRAVRATLTETATTMGTELLPLIVPLLQNFAALAKQYAPLIIARFSEFTTQMSETTGPALLLINDALTRIAAAFGSTGEEVTGADVLLGALGATLDAIVIGVKAFAIAMQGAAFAVEKTSEAIKIAIGLYEQLNAIWNAGTGGGGLVRGPGGQFNQAGGATQQSVNIGSVQFASTIELDGEKVGKAVSRYQGTQFGNYAALGGIGAQ